MNITHKICTKCKENKFITEFSLHSKKTGIINPSCRSCRIKCTMEWRKKHPEWAKNYMKKRYLDNPQKLLEQRRKWYHRNKQYLGYSLRSRQLRKDNPDFYKNKSLQYDYGITLTEYHAMYEAQNGQCAICHRSETVIFNRKVKALCVDHCHVTQKVRGLLCSACNGGLGLLREDPEILVNMISYINHHRPIREMVS